MANENDLRQGVAFVEEAVASVSMLQRGLAELGNRSQSDDVLDPMLQNLSSGFEHLLKLVLVFHAVHTDGEVGEQPWPRGLKGHDVEALLDLMVTRCFSPTFYPNQAPAIVEDARFLRTDQGLRRLMSILSHFGMQGRYHELNIAIGGKTVSDESPAQEFDRLELEVMMRTYPDWAERLGSSMGLELERAADAQIAATVRRAVRAIVRLFTLSPLDREAGQLTSVITPFLFLRDEDL
jgi:hypothetical protein